MALKERHYQEFADYLAEMSPDQAREHQKSVLQAQEAAAELAKLREKLEQDKKEQDEKTNAENAAFEAEQKRKMEEELAAYELDLSKEADEERKKNEKSILALNARKEALLKEKKAKAKQEMQKLASQGAPKEAQEQLLKEHSKDLAKLMNKMDADRMRMQRRSSSFGSSSSTSCMPRSTETPVAWISSIACRSWNSPGGDADGEGRAPTRDGGHDPRCADGASRTELREHR
jgi:hypothetical protein